MNLSIKKLTTEMYEEYLYYFDNTAFTDHEEWSACYCLESHLVKEEEEKYEGKEARREKAKELIEHGILNGYLIYDEEKIIGWCNCDDKMNYCPIVSNDEFNTGINEMGKIKAVYCIDIAPDYRGKGIADFIIDKVLEDARKEGYSYVEAYPFSDKSFAYQYHGPIRLYEKHGFETYSEKSWFVIMRKELV